jgi:hypothetical protein
MSQKVSHRPEQRQGVKDCLVNRGWVEGFAQAADGLAQRVWGDVSDTVQVMQSIFKSEALAYCAERFLLAGLKDENDADHRNVPSRFRDDWQRVRQGTFVPSALQAGRGLWVSFGRINPPIRRGHEWLRSRRMRCCIRGTLLANALSGGRSAQEAVRDGPG